MDYSANSLELFFCSMVMLCVIFFDSAPHDIKEFLHLIGRVGVDYCNVHGQRKSSANFIRRVTFGVNYSAVTCLYDYLSALSGVYPGNDNLG